MRISLFLLLTACAASKGTGDPGVEDLLAPVAAANDRAWAPLALEIVQEAEERLHLVEYVIYDSGSVSVLLDELEAAARRGVDVAVLADEASEDTPGVLARLEAAGARVQLDSPSRTTHNKLIIADDRALVGSHNFTDPALDENHEASLLVHDAAVVEALEGAFQSLWDDPAGDVSIGWQGEESITPLADAEVWPQLMGCLREAEERVRIVLYAMVYDADYYNGEPARLVREVVEAHQRGVDVSVILDDSAWIHDNGINEKAATFLRDAGVAVWTTPRDTVTHAKVLVCDDTVVVSDANWSYSGLMLYHGTSLLVRDPDLAQDYVAYFDTIKE